MESEMSKIQSQAPTLPPVLLYFHPSMKNLAEKIVKCTKDIASKESLVSQEAPKFHRTKREVQLSEAIQWNSFDDGFPNIFIRDVEYMAGKDVIFLGSFHTPGIIFEQLSILYMFPRYRARSFHFLLPYFPTGTMERVENEGEIPTAKTLASLLSHIPFTAKGPAQITIFDIHALQERFYFSDTVIPRLESATPQVKKALDTMFENKKYTVAFPDDGACKRFHRYFPDVDSIICNKIRNGSNRIVQIKDGDPKGKDVIIIDDLVLTGGTLKECGKVLLQHGANSISACVTHAVFPKESWRSFVDSNIFETFWITDSLPHALEIAKHKPFKVFSLCTAIANSLLGYDLLP
ncbi:ribose-phosphate pyrophosphokinase 4-like isoform X2 [Argonauta hians]